MLPFNCSKCEKSGTPLCTIPAESSALTFAVGNANDKNVGLNFFEKDDGQGNKTMYIGLASPMTAPFDNTGMTAISPGSAISGIHTAKDPNDNLTLQITGLDYNNSSDSAIGSVVVSGTIGCTVKFYKLNVTVSWGFEEVDAPEET